ncbi:glutamate carboxypeptidase 2 [Lingula anatina]|uniref:Glutamate carboxypeptidase 2 n=1 Tax=Lingula anatina TaxID=7574 RepID=A0A1S3ILV0_LINAN|nr:glutamate carboxypeptidase 2 [Lingula anatina]|eukprot:XP_013399197.1 glutamate carboxypeptidase 2 [Lingula anatina]
MARYVTYALNHEWHSYDMFLSASPGNGAIKKVIIAFVFALLMGALIGVLVAHVSHTEICSAQDRALANVLKTLIKERDSDARDRLLKAIDPGHIEYFQRHFGNATSPQELAEDAKKWWLDFGLDMAEVFTHNQLDEEEYQETEITVQYSNGVVLFRNQNILKVESDATKKLPAGLVEGDLIFANFGQRDDYQYLLDNLTHLRLEGKIAVVKEGKLSVEEKVHQAVAVHIRGLILYPKTHINHSALTNSNEALPPEDTPATGIDHLGHTLEIPVLTLSHQQADVFTGHMGGYPVPHMWLKDAVSHVGPGFRGTWAGSHVHLNVRDKRKEDSKLYAVVGKIRGSIEPDQYVLLYAHQHVVNVSLPYGSTMLTELARIYGKVMQSGKEGFFSLSPPPC